jgi:hypothetical protein
VVNYCDNSVHGLPHCAVVSDVTDMLEVHAAISQGRSVQVGE